MKAVIMAGGMGTRLRPICEKMPKPMTRLLGKPLLEHIVELARQNGFSQLCMTLAHQPESIREYFGNGERFGVSICYRVESTPLGTAGGVRACADFLDGDDFLVISGDAACDFDLRYLAREHLAHRSMVTMALYSHPEPLSYGTVITGPRDAVISFIEKPSWDRVVTDLVNTGVYMLSPEILKLIPENTPFDFAKDLFPLLTGKGMISGIPMKGYWCDIGNGKSFRQCSMDALDGTLRLPLCPAPEGLISPSLICPGAVVEPGAVLEHSVIHPGSRVESGAHIKNSVIDGAHIGKDCEISGSVICQGALLPSRTLTRPGDIISPFPCPEPAGSRPPSPQRKTKGLCRELYCGDRARLMRELSGVLWETGADFTDGIRFEDGKCKVHIFPVSHESAISIEAIGGREKERIALCEKYSRLAQRHGARPLSFNIQ